MGTMPGVPPYRRGRPGACGGGGDFAYAYVISHEMGHHIQDLLGILPSAQAAQQSAFSGAKANSISVRIELQADCLAGVWAANANQKWQVIEPGDVEKAIATAQAIGDDRLQKVTQGYAVPDSFTHGSAAQRVQWLERGLKSGKVADCDTFAPGELARRPTRRGQLEA